MLAGSGLTGPTVTEVALPAQVEPVSDETKAAVESELALAGKTVVLAVGSHEPRKNHLNLLLAAELNWRAGREFSLVMVGGNAWGDGEFKKFVTELRRKGRPVSLLSGVDDSVVWSLYRLSRFSVFCSVNEGFGLPVVESLASGTPVLTSDFGSMRELGDGFGALVANPHDPIDMSTAMAKLLDDDALVADLVRLSGGLRRPTWDDYAASLWSLVGA
jgi:glycosyltransferase involved in cell wall biosynthesis